MNVEKTKQMNKCPYCNGSGKRYITNHQASANDKSSAYIVYNMLIVYASENNKIVEETNIDIQYCPFGGRRL